ncbi:hypothetical protein F4813DRAFT_361969 [Daldinia decipiens]|uniref:uncharacterized protein n=1 Tax=Daldinia decipiens TaxID=326647 RepID=UPI0020C1CF9F|nr:uncharacterized protein F4813DRAFT_361969 [Daldinia decipiens]KAI1656823.1 hypothetical protein F4813DRAFT_361969 [Daldinia decipiens]
MSRTFQRMRSPFTRATHREQQEDDATQHSQKDRKQTSTSWSPFEVLYDDPTGKAEVDIVAVPGLGSDADWSWTWKDEGGLLPHVHWLKDPDMLPAIIPNSRIMAYSFEARWHSKAPQKIHLELCGEELINGLHNNRTDVLERPLIFIAHSLGGLVVLHALLYADRTRKFKYLPERTVGFAALGTPFTGTRMRGLAKASPQFMGPISFRTSVTIAQHQHKKHLRDKTHAFGQLRDKLDLPICCFIELHAIDHGKRFSISGLTRGRTVNEKSAHVPGWDRVFLHSDHLKLNKFSDPNDRSFLAVSNAIRSMYANQESLLERRKFNGHGSGKGNLKHLLSPPENFDVQTTHSNRFEQMPAYFVDRPDLLHRMTEEIGTNPRFRSILCLYGLAGCGKSLMARHFARSKDFTARFELPGTSEIDFSITLARYAEDIPSLIPPSHSVNLTRDISVIGKSHKLQNRERENIDAIINWLNAKGNNKWFILIDDVPFQQPSELVADESKHWVQHFVEKIQQGTIIITSQNSDFAQNYPNIHVDGLEDFECIRLIEKVIGIQEGSGDASYPKLAKLLDNHALSVQSAAQYMKNHRINAEDCIGLWRSQDWSIADDSKLDLDRSLTKTINLAIERLDSDARGFLLVCAFLDPECIWAELFPDLSHSRFYHIVRQLGSICLIRPVPNRRFGKAGIAIYPVVHRVARLLALQRSDVEMCINSAMHIVARAVPIEHAKGATDEQRRLLPHVLQCKENFEILNDYGMNIHRGLLPSLGHLGHLLQRRNQLDDAARIYAWTLNWYTRLSPIAHANDKSVDESRSVNSETQKIDRLHPEAAGYYAVLNNFGLVYKDRNEIEYAEKCFEVVRDSIGITIMKPYFWDLLDSKFGTNFALCLIQRGQLDDAEILLNKAKDIYEAFLGDDFKVQLLKIQQHLGTISKLRHDLINALERLSTASSGLQAILGNCLEFALATKELGSVFLLQDTVESLREAEKCFKEAEKCIEEHCEADCRVALDLQWHQLILRMAQCYMFKRGDEAAIQQACDDYEEHIQRLEELLPRNDIMTLNSIRIYGRLLIKLGRFHDGRRKLQRAIEGYKLQSNDPLQAASANEDLADGYLIYGIGNRHDTHNFVMAKEYYSKSLELFSSLNSSFANKFAANIQAKLHEIQQLLGSASQQQEVLPKRSTPMSHIDETV